MSGDRFGSYVKPPAGGVESTADQYPGEKDLSIRVENQEDWVNVWPDPSFERGGISYGSNVGRGSSLVYEGEYSLHFGDTFADADLPDIYVGNLAPYIASTYPIIRLVSQIYIDGDYGQISFELYDTSMNEIYSQQIITGDSSIPTEEWVSVDVTENADITASNLGYIRLYNSNGGYNYTYLDNFHVYIPVNLPEDPEIIRSNGLVTDFNPHRGLNIDEVKRRFVL